MLTFRKYVNPFLKTFLDLCKFLRYNATKEVMLMNNRMKQARKARKMTLKDVSDILQVTESAVSRYESGKINPTGAIVKIFCDALNISESWLRTGEGEMEVKPPEDLVDRLAREYNLGVGGVALLRAAARVINEFPDDVAVRLLDEIISDLQQAIAARQAVADPESRVVSDPNAPADSSVPPAGSRLG